MSDDIRKKINQDAEYWLMKLGSGDVSDQDRAAFKAWRTAHPSHAEAYAYHLALEAVTEEIFLEKSPPQKTIPWRRYASLAATLLVVAFIGLYDFPTIDKPANIHNTEIAELRHITLEDGSDVYLSANSKISVNYTVAERRLSLIEGQAYFTVEHDPERPFIVDVDGTAVRALGTAFDVHKHPHGISVAVVTGVVSVTRPPQAQDAPPTPVIVRKGQKISFAENIPQARIITAAPENFSTWQKGVLDYNFVDLETVIADVNRYSEGRIIIQDDSLRHLPVTAVLIPGDFAKVTDLLEQVLPVRAIHESERRIILVALPPAGRK